MAFRAMRASSERSVEVSRSLEHRVGAGRGLRDRLDQVPVSSGFVQWAAVLNNLGAHGHVVAMMVALK